MPQASRAQACSLEGYPPSALDHSRTLHHWRASHRSTPTLARTLNQAPYSHHHRRHRTRMPSSHTRLHFLLQTQHRFHFAAAVGTPCSRWHYNRPIPSCCWSGSCHGPCSPPRQQSYHCTCHLRIDFSEQASSDGRNLAPHGRCQLELLRMDQRLNSRLLSAAVGLPPPWKSPDDGIIISNSTSFCH